MKTAIEHRNSSPPSLVSSVAEKAFLERLSNSLLRDSVGDCAGEGYAPDRSDRAARAIVNVLSIAQGHRSANRERVDLLEDILRKSISEGRRSPVPDASLMKAKAYDAARLIFYYETFAWEVAEAFIAREPFTDIERANLASALETVRERVELAKSCYGEVRE
jgi:hypothetical protein